MAASNQSTINKEPRDNESLTQLIKILDEEQPYNKFSSISDPKLGTENNETIKKVQGSLIGLAVGDALGASVEFRPNAYLKQYPVSDMQSGGTWGLESGQWTDDTSMTLCLAASLIVKGKFDTYDQFVRYKRWYRSGYMSSTGKCFDIGKATREAITAFENRQREAVQELVKQNKSKNANDDKQLENYFRDNSININFGDKNSAGNGSLMRVAPIPLFYSQSWMGVEKNIDAGTKLTHGDEYAIEACRFYAGLIWHAINGTGKDVLLDPNFYRDKLRIELHGEIQEIAEGSYKNKKGYEGGIRGKGYVVNALEAALWAFYNDDDSFEKGVLLAVNLGDDTDTTAAIYGQLAGAVYGLESIPKKWVGQLFQAKFIMTLAKGLYLRGHHVKDERSKKTRPDPNVQNHDQTSADNTLYQGKPKTGVNTPHPVRPISAENSSHENKPNSKSNGSDHKKRANTITES